MSIVLLVAVGLVVGFAGAHIVPWRRSERLGWSMVAGIIGALGGVMMGRGVGYSANEPVLFVTSVFGAIVAVAMYAGVRRRKMA